MLRAHAVLQTQRDIVRPSERKSSRYARDVAVHGDGPLAELRRGLLSGGLVDIRDDNTGARGVETPHDGCADACMSTCPVMLLQVGLCCADFTALASG